MKKLLTAMAVAALAVAGTTSAIQAQDAASDNAVAVVVTGVNYCVPCALKEQGATAECGDTCNQLALKVTDIRDAEGDYVRGFVNKTLMYLVNAKGKEVTANAELKDQTLKIEGTLFKDERVLDVKTYEAVEGGAQQGIGTSGNVGAES